MLQNELKFNQKPAASIQLLTMSSREIAELVESRHDNVKKSMERLAKSGVIVVTAMQEPIYSGAYGSKQMASVLHVSKRDSYIVVAQLSPEFTARLVDRWQELEDQVAQSQFKIPQSFSEALLLAAELEEEKQVLEVKNHLLTEQVQESKPKAAFYDQVVRRKSQMEVGEAAQLLGTGRKRLYEYLRDIKWITQAGNRPMQFRVNNGELDYKYYQPEGKGKRDRVRVPGVMITNKGLARLEKLLRTH